MARGKKRWLQRDEQGRLQCRRCNEWREDAEFATGKQSPAQLCKDCLAEAVSEWSTHVSSPAAISRIRSTYGLEAAQHAAMFIRQRGLCAICQDPERSRKTDSPVSGLVVDHCHETGRVRGLLCARCNSAIGLLSEDHGTLKRASAYLRGHRRKVPRASQLDALSEVV